MIADHRQRSNLDPYAALAKKLPIFEWTQWIFNARVHRTLTDVLKKHKAHRVLDVCCGTGIFAQRLQRNGFEVIGLDSSPTMINHARSKKRVPLLHLLDATQMTFESEFDAAIISFALHEMSPDTRETVWQKMHNAVRQEGILIIADFAKNDRIDLPARLIQKFFVCGERSFLDHDPVHYENYCDWMSQGGALGWVKKHKENLLAEQYFSSGNICTIAVST